MWAAMGQDLRSFLDAVKRRAPDGFQVISRPVDPAYEITALAVKLEKERRKRPILLLEHVKGTKFPVLTNVHPSRSRLAIALNCSPDALLQIVHHQGDAGPYITSAISFVKDAVSDSWKCAYSRRMIQGRASRSVHLTLGKLLWEFPRSAEQRCEALALGVVSGVKPSI